MLLLVHSVSTPNPWKLAQTVGNLLGMPAKTAGSDFAVHFEGDYDSWANGVINRRNAMTRAQAYTTYVCTDETLGRANYLIMSRALANNMPCFYYNGTELKLIAGLSILDESDYTATATVVVA